MENQIISLTHENEIVIDNCVNYSLFCPQLSNGQLLKEEDINHAVINTTEILLEVFN